MLYINKSIHFEKIADKGKVAVKVINRLIYPNDIQPPLPTHLEKKGQNRWMVILNWSKEALKQATYEMNYWHMS